MAKIIVFLIGTALGFVSAIIIICLAADAEPDDWPDENQRHIPQK